jgi:hypothetical protein
VEPEKAWLNGQAKDNDFNPDLVLGAAWRQGLRKTDRPEN